MTDLEFFLKDRKKQGHEILLMWDANDNPSLAGSQMRRMIQSVGLVNLHAFYHGTDDEPNTYVQGKCQLISCMARRE